MGGRSERSERGLGQTKFAQKTPIAAREICAHRKRGVYFDHGFFY